MNINIKKIQIIFLLLLVSRDVLTPIEIYLKIVEQINQETKSFTKISAKLESNENIQTISVCVCAYVCAFDIAIKPGFFFYLTYCLSDLKNCTIPKEPRDLNKTSIF